MLKYPILETDFVDYFIDSENVEEIFLLSKEYSKKLWSKYINSNNPSYFKLENENWIVNGENTRLGNYRSDDFKFELQKHLKWDNSERIYFMLNHVFIIETSWQNFKNNFTDFINSEDDCPLLFNSNYNNCVVIFKSFGEVEIIKKQIPS